MPQGDGAGVLDLLQGAGQFFSHGWRSDHSGRDGGAQQLTNDTHQIFLDVFVFFMEPLADSFVQRIPQEALCIRLPSVEHDSCQALTMIITPRKAWA
ncbi:hypothetical protein D3C75_954920 [compost metagenome]